MSLISSAKCKSARSQNVYIRSNDAAECSFWFANPRFERKDEQKEASEVSDSCRKRERERERERES